jgi:hypothetical protein
MGEAMGLRRKAEKRGKGWLLPCWAWTAEEDSSFQLEGEDVFQ